MTAAKPETLAQAAYWDRVKRNGLGYGLCHGCAAQLAWAHQSHTGGFAAAHPPCAECAPLVARLPVARVNGWRTVSGDAGKPSNWVSTGGTGRPGIDGAEVAPSRLLRRPAGVDDLLRERE